MCQCSCKHAAGQTAKWCGQVACPHVSGLRSLLGVSSMQSAPRLLRSLTRRCGAAATSASEAHETSRPLTHMLASTSDSTAVVAAALGAHEQPAPRQVAWQSPAWLQRNLWPCNGVLLDWSSAHKQEQQQQHGQQPWQQLEARRWLRSSTSMTAAAAGSDSGSAIDPAKGVKGPAVHSPLQDLFGSTGTQTPATSPLQGGAGGLYRPSGTGTGPALPTPRSWAWYDEDDERKEQRKERSGLALRCEWENGQCASLSASLKGRQNALLQGALGGLERTCSYVWYLFQPAALGDRSERVRRLLFIVCVWQRTITKTAS